MQIRQGSASDLPQIVSLVQAERADLAKRQPVYWRPHEDAEVRTLGWFGHLLEKPETILLVAENDDLTLSGFLIATLQAAPPVYDPGGPTCMIDDFIVANSQVREDTLSGLFQEASARAKTQGAKQIVVVAVRHDTEKASLLEQAGLEDVCAWWTKSLD